MIINSSTPRLVCSGSGQFQRLTFYNPGPGNAYVLIGGHPVTTEKYTNKLAPGQFMVEEEVSGDVSAMVDDGATNLSAQVVSYEGVSTAGISDALKPIVSVVATDPTADESGATGYFTFARDISAGALTVNFAVTGTATDGVDYVSIGTTVSFADGDASKIVVINPYGDVLAESTETAIVTISPSANYAVSTSPLNTATVSIANTSTPVTVTVISTVSEASPLQPGGIGQQVSEVVNDGIWTFTRSGSTASALTANIVLSGTGVMGVAPSATADYCQWVGGVATAIGSTVVFGIGVAAVAKTVRIHSQNGTPLSFANSGADGAGVDSADRTAIVTVTAGTGYAPGSPATATINLRRFPHFVGSVALASNTATRVRITFTPGGAMAGGVADTKISSITLHNLTTSTDIETSTGATATEFSDYTVAPGNVSNYAIVVSRVLTNATITNYSTVVALTVPNDVNGVDALPIAVAGAALTFIRGAPQTLPGPFAKLTWSAATETTERIEIEKSLNGTAFSHIATLAPTAVTYTDTVKLGSAVPYWYRIRSVNRRDTAYAAPGVYSALTATTSGLAVPTFFWKIESLAAAATPDAMGSSVPLTVRSSGFSLQAGGAFAGSDYALRADAIDTGFQSYTKSLVADSPLIDLSTLTVGFTIAFWCQRATGNTTQFGDFVQISEDGVWPQFYLYQHAADWMYCMGTLATYWSVTRATTHTDSWRRIIFCWDKVNKKTFFKVNSTAHSLIDLTAYPFGQTSQKKLIISPKVAGSTGARIDLVAFYRDKILTDAEMQADYDASLPFWFETP